MLTSKIRVVLPSSDEETPEDIFSSGLEVVFTDHVRDQHGDSGAKIIYMSNEHGDLELSVPDPGNEDERRLFAHYLWNAGEGRVSVFIENQKLIMPGVLVTTRIEEDRPPWSASGRRMLELGAGLGLPGIVGCLKGAQEVAP